MRVFIKDTLDILKEIYPEGYEEKKKRYLDLDEIGPENINSFVADIFVPKMIDEMNESESEEDEVYISEVYVNKTNDTIADDEDDIADVERIAREAAEEAWKSYLRYRATKNATYEIENKSNITNIVEYHQEWRNYKSPKWSWKNKRHYNRKNRSWKATTHVAHQWARHVK